MKKDIFRHYPELEKLSKKEKFFWMNHNKGKTADILPGLDVSMEDVLDAGLRLEKFAALLERLFPELEKTGGIFVPFEEFKRFLK